MVSLTRRQFVIKSSLLVVGLELLHKPVDARVSEIFITGNDDLRYNLKKITVPRGIVKITLKHIGTSSRDHHGHNVVLTKKQDLVPVAIASQNAGLENEYIPPNDNRVLAHTSLIGGGETTSITFDTSNWEEADYVFFCSVPGHWTVMRGDFIIS